MLSFSFNLYESTSIRNVMSAQHWPCPVLHKASRDVLCFACDYVVTSSRLHSIYGCRSFKLSITPGIFPEALVYIWTPPQLGVPAQALRFGFTVRCIRDE